MQLATRPERLASGTTARNLRSIRWIADSTSSTGSPRGIGGTTSILLWITIDAESGAADLLSTTLPIMRSISSEENRDRPFFCYLPINTPHSPMMVADRFYDRFADRDLKLRHRDPDREDLMMTRAALAMCENIDWNVGRLLSAVDDFGLRDNTIVIYFSDNGPNSYRWNGDLKGRKGSIDEGGLRSPFFIRWPKRIAAGRHLNQVAGAIDLLPTLVALTGISSRPEKPLDGINLASLLSGQSDSLSRPPLLSIKRNQVSVRTQRFRLDASGALFEIASDPGQRHNVADQHPQITRQLGRLAAEHNRQMQAAFAANADRPFHVGFGASTTLPARDGVEHGTIQRSAKAPNNSFFTHWSSPD